MKKFSIVIPIYNEYENIKSLHTEIINSTKYIKNTEFEIIFIDDASIDGSKELLKEIKKKHNIKLIHNLSNLGQSKSISIGVKSSSHADIITIDGDGQNDPNDIPKLIHVYLQSNLSLIGGIRKKRKDSFIKIFSSFVANQIREYILKDNCKDTGCSLKIFKKDIFLQFPYFDGIHRFLPALYLGFGYNTFFINVNHRNRKFGVSKYGTFKRLLYGIRDIIKVYKIIRNYNGRLSK